MKISLFLILAIVASGCATTNIDESVREAADDERTSSIEEEMQRTGVLCKRFWTVAEIAVNNSIIAMERCKAGSTKNCRVAVIYSRTLSRSPEAIRLCNASGYPPPAGFRLAVGRAVAVSGD